MSKVQLNRRILIVGEGRETEYNYFVGFRKAFESKLEATATSVSVKRGKGGDARQIVKTAINELKKFKPDPKAGDRVFLLLDTEGAGRAAELPAAELLAKKNNIEIIYSSPAFEYWLLCHFQKPPRRHFKNCETVIVELNKQWSGVCKTQYDKADQDLFNRLKEFLSTACTQALEIDTHLTKTSQTAVKINPSTQVYELIAILIGAYSGDRCPIAGEWKLVADKTAVIKLQKGDPVPDHGDASAHWQL
ncbi:MAG: RloB family protein [Gemmataceae bacterium]